MIYNTKTLLSVCFFCCFVLNKCHKVIPHNVITWSFFFFSSSCFDSSFRAHSSSRPIPWSWLDVLPLLPLRLSFCVFAACLLSIIVHIHAIWMAMPFIRNKRTDEKSYLKRRDASTSSNPPKISFSLSFNRIYFTSTLTVCVPRTYFIVCSECEPHFWLHSPQKEKKKIERKWNILNFQQGIQPVSVQFYYILLKFASLFLITSFL